MNSCLMTQKHILSVLTMWRQTYITYKLISPSNLNILHFVKNRNVFYKLLLSCILLCRHGQPVCYSRVNNATNPSPFAVTLREQGHFPFKQVMVLVLVSWVISKVTLVDFMSLGSAAQQQNTCNCQSFNYLKIMCPSNKKAQSQQIKTNFQHILLTLYPTYRYRSPKVPFSYIIQL